MTIQKNNVKSISEKDFTLEEFKLILSSLSQRITEPRLDILGILKENHNPLTILNLKIKKLILLLFTELSISLQNSGL